MVWSPVDQGGINEVEKIQQVFTKKIEGMVCIAWREERYIIYMGGSNWKILTRMSWG